MGRPMTCRIWAFGGVDIKLPAPKSPLNDTVPLVLTYLPQVSTYLPTREPKRGLFAAVLELPYSRTRRWLARPHWIVVVVAKRRPHARLCRQLCTLGVLGYEYRCPCHTLLQAKRQPMDKHRPWRLHGATSIIICKVEESRGWP